jgi:hypothetical protein
VGRGVFRGTGRSRRIVFRVRRKKVTFVAVVDHTLAARRRTLRSYVRLAHL